MNEPTKIYLAWSAFGSQNAYEVLVSIHKSEETAYYAAIKGSPWGVGRTGCMELKD